MNLARALFDSFVAYRTANPFKPTSVEEAMDRQRQIEAKWAHAPIPSLNGLTPRECLAAIESAEEWVSFLTNWAGWMEGGEYPHPLRDAVGARLTEMGPHLAAIVSNPALADKGAPGAGYAPVLCANLLGDLRYEPAIPALLGVIERTAEFTQLGDAAMGALMNLGSSPLDGLHALCERYKRDVDSVPYARALELLVRLPRTDLTWEYLKEGLQKTASLAGLYIALAADYGDQRAVFQLNTLLEERADLSDGDREEALEAIRMLGGIPTAKARATVTLDPDRPPLGKVGRNDPCPCGSGLKYKKCCGK